MVEMQEIWKSSAFVDRGESLGRVNTNLCRSVQLKVAVAKKPGRGMFRIPQQYFRATQDGSQRIAIRWRHFLGSCFISNTGSKERIRFAKGSSSLTLRRE